MAKRRVENDGEAVMKNIVIDDTPQQETLTVIPKREKPVEPTVSHTREVEMSNGLINCLRNERICVRYIKRPTYMVQNPKHILYGGMAESATRSFCVPRLTSGIFKNVLTDKEKEFLEHAMGLEFNALSIYRKENNFWDDSNPSGIGKVILHKQDNYLDLSIPEDYIKYKVLLANKDYIAKSLQELEDRPKETYQFVLISENAEAAASLSKMDTIQRCYMEYGKVEDDFYTLRTLVEILEGRPTAPKIKIDYLKGKMNDYIQKNPRHFLSAIKDELLPAKVLIKKCVEAGLIGKKNDAYYLREDGSPLCEMNEESTLNNAAKYLSSVKRQELKFTLEAKLKQV